jgi:hypothetical protein
LGGLRYWFGVLKLALSGPRVSPAWQGEANLECGVAGACAGAALAFLGLGVLIVAMSYVMVDIESDGPIPGDYSMVSFGAVIVEVGLARSFYGQLKPISEQWIPEALAVGGFSREQTLAFDDPKAVMDDFYMWLSGNCGKRKIFISDNNGFDWQFINWYFHHFHGDNPFGHSSQNLGSLYKGLVKDTFKSFKHLRVTEHTHHPVDDAKGNAEALLRMNAELGLEISFD